jgi:integrase
VNLGEAVDHFLGDVARRCAPRTHTKYEQLAEKFVAHLGKNYPVHEVRSEHCLGWLSQWKHRKPKTQALHDTVLREFFKFLVSMDYLEPNQNPMLKVRKVKVPPIEDRDVKTISADEVRKVIASCQTWTEMLTVAILSCMGVRRQAACDLRWKHVNLKTGHITFQEKGRKTIKKPIPAMLHTLLQQAHAELDSVPDDYVIPSLREPKRKERDPHFLWRTVKEVSKRAGVDAHCHSFRAAFAVHYLETHTGDLEALQPLMGHKHLATTQGYLKRLQRDTAMERVRDLDWGVMFDSPKVSDNGSLTEGVREGTPRLHGDESPAAAEGNLGSAAPSVSDPEGALSEAQRELPVPPNREAGASLSASSEPESSPLSGSSDVSGVHAAARSTSDGALIRGSGCFPGLAVRAKSGPTESLEGHAQAPSPRMSASSRQGERLAAHHTLPHSVETAGLGFEPRLNDSGLNAEETQNASLLVNEMSATVVHMTDFLVPLTRRVTV